MEIKPIESEVVFSGRSRSFEATFLMGNCLVMHFWTVFKPRWVKSELLLFFLRALLDLSERHEFPDGSEDCLKNFKEDIFS